MKKEKPNIQENMWKGAPPESFAKAEQLRLRSTVAESILWEKLRNRQLAETKFRRQHPIGIYIVDFYCHLHKLIIEVDGDYHFTEEQQIKDSERTMHLNSSGLKVIRFTNDEIEKNVEEVLRVIKATILEITDKKA